jgi:predicted DNA-binding helix-hairpin-helix protein
VRWRKTRFFDLGGLTPIEILSSPSLKIQGMVFLATEDKLALLGYAARHDLCGTAPVRMSRRPRRYRSVPPGLYPAVLPDGKMACLFKVLLTNACANDCAYCQNRLGGRGREASFRPEELARVFMQLRYRGLAEGLFLSSGIPGEPDAVMKDMVDVLELLRNKYAYKGYIHVKILPGSSRAAVERACQLANRASINLEFPNSDRLHAASVRKDFEGDLLSRLAWLGEIHRNGLLKSGLTTQFVVGAAGENDAEILSTLSAVYGNHSLRRAYFSSFNPLPGTPWEDKPPASTLREHRLYQADFLHRLYNFALEEIPLDVGGHLQLDKDPKSAWADIHPEFFPVEINQADLKTLLRVPGIGCTSAERIVDARKECRLRDLGQLKKLGAVAARAAPYILLDGHTPPVIPRREPAPDQLTFW